MFKTVRTIAPRFSVRGFSTSRSVATGLRIGYVPEHFSTPLWFAQKYFGLHADLVPYPSGTGHMVQSLKEQELDVAIGLTEGWVAGLAKPNVQGKEPYKLVGTYVESPLCWAISTGSKRDITNVSQLNGGRVGVSRIGSGSYVMSFVLADQQGWLNKSGKHSFEFIPLNTFENLRKAVNDGTADFFMWEHFTSKRYYDNGEIKRVGEIYTPWSSWKIVAREPAEPRVREMYDSINKGIEYFKNNQEEAVEYISTRLDYSVEDAREWLKTVRFADNVVGVDLRVIDKTIDILGTAGVLDARACSTGEMVAIKRPPF